MLQIYILHDNLLLRSSSFLVLLLFSFFALGQTQIVEDHPLYRSVQPTIIRNQPDSFALKINRYRGSLADSLVARVLCQAALERGFRTGSKLWELEAYHAFSIFHSFKGDKKTALRYAQKAEGLLAHGKLRHRLKNYNLQGVYYRGLRLNEMAIESYSQGITVLENASDKAKHARIGTVLYFNRSSIYLETENALPALSDCLKALEFVDLNKEATQRLEYRMMSRLYMIQKEIGDTANLKSSLTNVVRLALENKTPYDSLMAMGYKIELSASVEEGEQYLEQGKQIAKGYDQSVLNKASLLYQMGLLYRKHGMLCQQEEMIEQLISLYPDTSTIETPLVLAYLTRSQILLERRQVEEAVYWAKEAIAGSRVLGNKTKELEAIKLLSKAYAEQRNYNKAYLTKVIESKLEDSLKVINKPATLLKTYLGYQYEQEKKIIALKTEQAQALLNAKLLWQKKLIIVFLVFLLLLSGLIYLLIKNIKIKRNSERYLIQQQELLQRSNKQLKLYSDIVSHDVLNNLELIIASGNVLVGANESNERLMNYYLTTNSIAVKLKKYCVDLLAIAKNKTTFFLVSAKQANRLLSDILQHYKHHLTEAGFNVSSMKMPDLPIPAVVLEQFLHVGITNALKYVPQPHKRPILKTGFSLDEYDQVSLFIEDNGPGIDAATKAAIHEEENLSREGSHGIGLANLRKNLSLYDLELGISNAEGGGVRLTMSQRASH